MTHSGCRRSEFVRREIISYWITSSAGGQQRFRDDQASHSLDPLRTRGHKSYWITSSVMANSISPSALADGRSRRPSADEDQCPRGWPPAKFAPEDAAPT
jgi:hypothetical protein